MTDHVLVACPNCQKHYKIHQVAQVKTVRCAKCEHKFQVGPQPEIVEATIVPTVVPNRPRQAPVKKPTASVEHATTGMSTGIKLLIAGLVAGIVCLICAVGILTWFMATKESIVQAPRVQVQSQPTPARSIELPSPDAHLENKPVAKPVEPKSNSIASSEPAFEPRDTPDDPFAQSNLPQPVLDTPRAEPKRQPPVQPKAKPLISAGALAYDFVEADRADRGSNVTDDGISSPDPVVFEVKETKGGRVPNRAVAIFEDLGWGVNSLAFSPDGNLYAGKMDRALLAFSVKKRRKIDERTDLEDLGQLQVTTVTPNGRYLLTGGYTGRIDVWKLRNGGQLKEGKSFAGHSEEIKVITVSPDSSIAISGGSDKRVRIWDIETCKEIAAFDGFKRGVLATFIAPDNSYAFASDGYGVMKIDLKTNNMVSHPKVLDRYPHAAAFSPDGSKLAVSEGYDVHIVDTTSFVEELVLKGPSDIHYSLVFDKSGQYLFAGGGHVTQWDWAKGKALNEYHISDYATIKTIAITDDGTQLATIGSSAGQDLKVFKIRNNDGSEGDDAEKGDSKK